MAKDKTRTEPQGQPPNRILPAFDRIYFDTEPLLAAGWPRLSVPLENVASLARDLNVSLHVPDVAYLELEARYLAARDAEYNEVVARISQLRSRLKELGGDPSQIPALPDVRAEMRKRYLAVVESRKQVFAPTPTPPLDIQNLLKMAVAHELAFEDDDKGFKDTVIFLSVIEEIKRSPKQMTSAIVSRDHVFRERGDELQAWAKSAGVSITLCETVDQIERALELRLPARDQTQLQTRVLALFEALDQRRAEVQDWLDRNVESWNWQITPFKIYRAEVLRLMSVTLQHGSSRSDAVRVKLSFNVEARLRGSYLQTVPVHISTAPKVPAPHFGSASSATLDDLSDYLYSTPIPRLEPVMGSYVAVIEIDAEAIFGHGTYSDFKFLTARWSVPPVSTPRNDG